MNTARTMFDLAIDQLTLLRQIRDIDKASESVAAMAASIQEIGLQQPLTVRQHDGVYILLDGEKRYWAHVLLGRTHVPVILEEGELSESDVIQRQLIPNCHREELTPLEKARAIDRLMKAAGWSASQTAAKLAMSNSSVTRHLSLLTMRPELIAKLETGELGASVAYELSKVGDATEQLHLANQAAAGHLTRDALSGKIKAAKKAAPDSGPAKGSRITARLGDNRTITVTANPLTLETLVELLDLLRNKAKQAQTKGFSLDTFTKMLTDESRRQIGDTHV